MIGIILTGHGEFAPGVAHALRMIAGTQKAFKVVAFKEDEPIEMLERKMHQAVDELISSCEGVVIFADLLGGSPFKAAMLVTHGLSNVEVVCGANLPMLIEVAMFREFAPTALAVVEQSVQAGKTGVQHIVLSAEMVAETIDEDGI